MKHIAIKALLLAALSSSVFAVENAGTAYLAADVGVAKYTNAGDYKDPSAFRIAGGYQLTKNFAAEVGYTVFGDSTVTYNYSGSVYSDEFSAYSTHVALVGSLPLSDKFDLTGKVGYTSNHAKITTTYAYGYTVKSTNNTALFGVGAQYHFTPKLSIRAQYENYGEFGKFEADPDAAKAATYTLGVAYHF